LSEAYERNGDDLITATQIAVGLYLCQPGCHLEPSPILPGHAASGVGLGLGLSLGLGQSGQASLQTFAPEVFELRFLDFIG
jgi:hypothetical protein